jgi:hypothetical protein
MKAESQIPKNWLNIWRRALFKKVVDFDILYILGGWKL